MSSPPSLLFASLPSFLRRATAVTSSTTAGSAATTAAAATTRSHEIQSRFLPDIHPLQLFRVVQDVDKYKDFLPLCSESKVFPDTIKDGGRSFQAELVVGFGPLGSMFKTRYISQVSVDPNGLRIETRSDDSISADAASSSSNSSSSSSSSSMFDSLTSSWELRPVRGGLSESEDKTTSNDDDNDNDDDDNNNSSTVVVGTSVDFKVEMTVSDPVTIAVLNQVLYNVAESQVNAFHKRCQELPSPSLEEVEFAESFNDNITATTSR